MSIRNGLVSLESTPDDDMKAFVLSLAREVRLDTGRILPLNILKWRIQVFNPKQKEALEPALESLTKCGVFDKKDNEFYLTVAGRDVLYP